MIHSLFDLLSSPDIVWQNDEVRPIFPCRQVVRLRTRKASSILIPDPTTIRGFLLSTASSSIVESHFSVEVVRDLIGLLWDAIDEARTEVLWSSASDA